tara:strand:+ start:867 stop:1262 length:396 start_codon:yes stop_codon:yes gene_type:complete
MESLERILNPKIWLIIVAIGHTLATIIPVLSENASLQNTEVEYAIWRFVSMVLPMLFIAIALEGEIQARLTTVIAGPIWVMFVLWQAMDGITVELLPPTLLWGVLAMSGVMHGNWEDFSLENKLFSDDSSE